MRKNFVVRPTYFDRYNMNCVIRVLYSKYYPVPALICLQIFLVKQNVKNILINPQGLFYYSLIYWYLIDPQLFNVI